MKHIAMLTCLNANAVCTGASCLKAFYDRTGSFAIYQTEALYLDAFMKCNGCEILQIQTMACWKK
ncbi:MAG: CGGC domain-containing protein [Eubacteriales bacterium]